MVVLPQEDLGHVRSCGTGLLKAMLRLVLSQCRTHGQNVWDTFLGMTTFTSPRQLVHIPKTRQLMCVVVVVVVVVVIITIISEKKYTV